MEASPSTPHVHRVLVVDDSLDVLTATSAFLEFHGCEVATADGGRAALHAFACGLRPCMVLLDLRMPGMDGWEVWERMRAHRDMRRTPVVMHSGELPDDDRARAVGVCGFVQKARPASEIFAAVVQYCRVTRGGAAE